MISAVLFIADRNDRAVGFGREFEASLMKQQHIQTAFAPACSLREDEDGDSILIFSIPSQNRL